MGGGYQHSIRDVADGVQDIWDFDSTLRGILWNLIRRRGITKDKRGIKPKNCSTLYMWNNWWNKEWVRGIKPFLWNKQSIASNKILFHIIPLSTAWN